MKCLGQDHTAGGRQSWDQDADSNAGPLHLTSQRHRAMQRGTGTEKWGDRRERDKERNRNGQRKPEKKGNEGGKGGTRKPERLFPCLAMYPFGVGLAVPGMGPPNLRLGLLA